MARLSNCLNTRDFEAVAKRRLPSPLYHYLAGGADDEATQAMNTAAYEKYALVPRFLKDVRKIDMGRKVFGRQLNWPILLAPTGMSRLFHPDGEIGSAKAAADSGIGYCLSTMGSTSLETISECGPRLKVFQLYLLNDDGLNRQIIDRCKEAGYDAIVITVDTVWAGNRERDLRTGLTVPPNFTVGTLAAFAARPRWCLGYFSGAKFALPNISSNAEKDLSTLTTYFAEKMEKFISWERVEALAEYWGKPFSIKGLQSVEDARIAASVGCSGIIVSNHGGRQLDGGNATIDLVADIADEVGERLEILVDGGIRRGSHIVKALAMGARACLIGRPYLYGLAAYGTEGVARVLSLLHDETERTLGLLGCSNIDDLCREHVTSATKLPRFLQEETQTSALAKANENYRSVG